MRKQQGASDLEVRRFRSVRALREKEWDRILPSHGVLQSYRLVRAVEEARVEDADFWYLMFYHRGTLVGSAALSAFRVSLDLLAEGKGASWPERLRRVDPRFLRPRVLCCGLPLSVGAHHLVVAREAQGEAIVRALAREMERIARAERIGWLVVKEFKGALPDYLQALARLGYHRAPSLPYMRMALPWSDVGEWMGAMRHGYRRHLRLTLAANGWTVPVVRGPGEAVARGGPELRRGGPELCPPKEFHRLYESVMERASERMEWLNLQFFQRLYALLGDRLQMLAFRQDGRTEAAALLLPDGDTLTFLLAGMEDPRGKPTLPYLNLLAGLVALAIDGGYRWLNLGQTATWAKQQLGAQGQEVHFFLRARQPWWNYVIKKGGRWIFPPRRLPETRVFREQNPA